LPLTMNSATPFAANSYTSDAQLQQSDSGPAV